PPRGTGTRGPTTASPPSAASRYPRSGSFAPRPARPRASTEPSLSPAAVAPTTSCFPGRGWRAEGPPGSDRVGEGPAGSEGTAEEPGATGGPAGSPGSGE